MWQGRASGSRGALWMRTLLQDQLQQAGQFCDTHAGKVLFVAILVLSSFCVGLKSATLVTDVQQLWVQGEFSRSYLIAQSLRESCLKGRNARINKKFPYILFRITRGSSGYNFCCYLVLLYLNGVLTRRVRS